MNMNGISMLEVMVVSAMLGNARQCSALLPSVAAQPALAVRASLASLASLVAFDSFEAKTF